MNNETWNTRYRRYIELAQSERYMDLKIVQTELEKLKLEKELSFGERKLLDHVNAKLDGTYQSNSNVIQFKTRGEA